MEVKFLFKINKAKWDALVNLRGWDSPVTILANRTGFSKSYVSQAINGGIPISQDFMLAYIKVSGNDHTKPDEWASLFDIEKAPYVTKGNTSDNFAKMTGKKEYVPYSQEGAIRVRDKAKSLERLKAEKPVPALDFYDYAMPSRFQMAHRYGKR
jgi:hypothetical protein